jgi:peptidoglycan/LPS O-acetylase OafA/YrhL
LVKLGKASFSVYILHWPVWMILDQVFGSSSFAVSQPNLYFGLYFIFTTALACLCFKYIEEPMNRALRGKFINSSSAARYPATIIPQHESATLT